MSEVKAKKHVCGLHGFNPMLGDNCEKCDETKELLPCPFCGDEAMKVVCPWNSDEVAITCPSNNCLVFGRQGIGDRRLTYGPRWAVRNWWNTRANKTQ